jgi:hypothetical protein
MVTPITSHPCSFRSQAATLESTPPLIPTTTRRESGDGDRDGVLMGFSGMGGMEKLLLIQRGVNEGGRRKFQG